MSDTKRERVLDKIKKLLAMSSEGSGASETERETALRQANFMMDKNQIEMIDAHEHGEDTRDTESIVMGRHPWKASVFSAVGKLYGCHVYRTRGSSGKVYITGKKSIREVVIIMGDYVIDSIDRESRNLPRSGRSFTSSFRNGATSGLYDQVERLVVDRKKGNEEGISTAKGLVLTDFYKQEHSDNASFLAAAGVRLTSAKGSVSRDSNAFAMGHSYGNSISLNSQLGGATAGRLR